jgi:hypothetical protein
VSTITMGPIAPIVGDGNTIGPDVTVRVPSGTTGYTSDWRYSLGYVRVYYY